MLAADGRYRQLYDKQYKFERDSSSTPAKTHAEPPSLKERLPQRLPEL